MRKIILLCAGGLSTSILVKKMEKYAEKVEYACTIRAYGKDLARDVASDADIVLLGPQIAYAKAEVQREIPNVLIYQMGMTDYGTQRADVFIEKVKELLGDK